MIYKKKLCRERSHETVTRKITIVLSRNSNPGFIVEVEDIGATGHVYLSRVPGVRTPKWILAKADAIAVADGIVEFSMNEGFVSEPV